MRSNAYAHMLSYFIKQNSVSQEEKDWEEGVKLKRNSRIRRSFELCRSKRALALPVTFLILLVSSLIIVSFTYYLAVERIGARSQSLKVSMARENMINLDEDISSTLWQSGSSRTLDFKDCGGQLNVHPSVNPLAIGVTDGNGIEATVFNSTVGLVFYELPYSETADTGLFLAGDARNIVYQNSSMTQLFIQEGVQRAEIVLKYRPSVSYIASGIEGNKTVNNIRIFVVTLSASQNIELMGDIPLKIASEAIEEVTTSFNVAYQPGALQITADPGASQDQLSIPIASTGYGAIVNVELILCKIQITRWVR